MVEIIQIEKGTLKQGQPHVIAYWWREAGNYSRVNFYDNNKNVGKRVYHSARASDKDIGEKVAIFVQGYLRRSKDLSFKIRENKLYGDIKKESMNRFGKTRARFKN